MASDRRLIDAVESGNPVDVRTILDAGASANVRKLVSLNVRVIEENGNVAPRTDTIECESALALAIIHNQPEIVEVLLASGATTGEITWRDSTWWDRDLTIEEWDTRWLLAYSFPSAICLAVGRGGTLTRLSDGQKAEAPDGKGRVAGNKPGGIVHIENPKSLDDVRVLMELKPSIAVVQALLSQGAPVTDVELKAAKANPDTTFFELLLRHATKSPDVNTSQAPASPQQSQASQHTQFLPPSKSSIVSQSSQASHVSQGLHNPLARSQSVASSKVTTPQSPDVTSLASLLRDSTERIERLTARAVAAEARVAELEKSAEESKTQTNTAVEQNSQMQDRVKELEKDNSSLRLENTKLRSSSLTLISEKTAIQFRLTALEKENTSLRDENSSLRTRITQMGAGKSSEPTPVEAVMYAIADFEPRDADELRLRVGERVFVNLAFADGWGSGFNTSTNAAGVFPLVAVAQKAPTAPSGPNASTITSTTARFDSRLHTIPAVGAGGALAS
ncbi:hypothetical protein HDU93_004782, partial [Gonapodya sp. JEL0774]